MRLLLIFLLVFNFGASPLPGVPATVYEDDNVYVGPGHTYARLDHLRAGTPITITERNRIGNWLHIIWGEAGDGWMMIGDINLPEGFKLSELPINDELADADVSGIVDEALAELYSVPTLPEIQPETCAIYENGNGTNAVSKVGDSNSASDVYLAPISAGQYDLGPYDFLQATTDEFGASFGIRSAAAKVGMNTASVLDSMWSDQQVCEAGESPLTCEYRRTQPSVAVIMFGVNDTRVFSTTDYEAQLRQIVEETLNADILPILIAFSTNPNEENYHQTVRFNLITHRIAAEYDVPFINFWAAARALSRGGVGDDNVHLTTPGGSLNLGRNESLYGLPLHNLLVLHTLDALRTSCDKQGE